MKSAICLLACCFAVPATPAFADKVTLGCSLGGNYITQYFTIDSDAKTVTDSSGTYPAQITDDAVSWVATNVPYNHQRTSTYNRNTAQVWGWYSGFSNDIPCVKAPARPF